MVVSRYTFFTLLPFQTKNNKNMDTLQQLPRLLPVLSVLLLLPLLKLILIIIQLASQFFGSFVTLSSREKIPNNTANIFFNSLVCLRLTSNKQDAE